MKRTPTLLTTTVVATALFSGSVKAQEPATMVPEPSYPVPSKTPLEPERKTADRPWTFATGLGFGSGLGQYAGLAAPGGYLLFERKLFGPVSLMGRFLGSYVDATYASASSTGGYESSVEGGVVQGGAGLRVLFTPPEMLGVSVFGLLEGWHSRTSWGDEGDSWSNVSRMKQRGVGAQVGVSLDREIVPGFGVRVSTILASGENAQRELEYRSAGQPTHYQEDVIQAVSLRIAPALEMRWSF